jgi:phage/plasmid-like protein (TIGR03299 family)
MAHELYQIGSEHSMAYANDTPWHGLGQQVDPTISLEEWSKKAHLDWEVVEGKVEVVVPGAGFRGSDVRLPMNDKKAFYRSDNWQPLSVVGSKYKPVQPLEVLEFFRDLVEEHGFVMETAGSVMDGRRVWALAHINDAFTLPGNDLVKGYLLLATSCDRSMSTTVALTSTRVVCNNTLELAYGKANSNSKASSAIRIPHAATFNADKVKLDLFGIESSWAKFRGLSGRLAAETITEHQAVKFFMNLYHNKKLGNDYSDVPPRTVTALFDLFREGVGSGMESARGTAWGALNAVTRLVDHVRGRGVDTRLQSAWFGEGRILKLRSWKMACELAGIVNEAEVEEEANL